MPISAEDHLKWVRTVARGVREAYGFVMASQEEQDLEQHGYVLLLERLIPHFENEPYILDSSNPIDSFRKAAHRTLKTELQREAERMRNGGTFRTRRPGKPQVILEPIHRICDDDFSKLDYDDAITEPFPMATTPAATTDEKPDLGLFDAQILEFRNKATLMENLKEPLRKVAEIVQCHDWLFDMAIEMLEACRKRRRERDGVKPDGGKKPGRSRAS